MSRPICLINDLIPPALDYHRLAMPIALVCRSIEFSLVINCIQFFLSIVAVYGSLKGKKIFFIICFNFIIVLIIFGGLFLILLIIIISKKLVLKSTFTLFFILYQDDDEFCYVIEPVLSCHQYNIGPIDKKNDTIFKDISFDGDIIEKKCGNRTSNIKNNENDCIEYLTNVTLSYKWIIYISIMYFLFLIILIVQVMRIISCKNKNKYFGSLILNSGRGNENRMVVEEKKKIVEKRGNDLIIEDNGNQNCDVQEFEMVTIYLNDKQCKNDESVEFL